MKSFLPAMTSASKFQVIIALQAVVMIWMGYSLAGSFHATLYKEWPFGMDTQRLLFMPFGDRQTHPTIGLILLFLSLSVKNMGIGIAFIWWLQQQKKLIEYLRDQAEREQAFAKAAADFIMSRITTK
jgi:hypothetical protein